MISPLRLAAALAAACALAGCRATPPARAAVSERPGPGQAASPRSPEEALPGIALDDLSEGERVILARFAESTYCHCGCPHTLADCLATHGACTHAPRMARLAARLVRMGAAPHDLKRILGDYYASFDRRATLDLAGFGPPLGSGDAPVTLVEFSDFTCPFCAQLRPVLEAFVEGSGGRVKLHFKPFPIESHPGALEAALAAEWARERGVFWPMHDALFASGDHSLDGIAAAARAIGADEEDLRDALAARRHEAKVRRSQAEARAAGLRGTPTLFLDGRRLVLPDYSPWALEHTLEDEEEWRRHGGWARD